MVYILYPRVTYLLILPQILHYINAFIIFNPISLYKLLLIKLKVCPDWDYLTLL
jgi:hypothetical protein